MIQIYTGDGKGKTTAAFGLSMRAVGHGLTVAVIQFMKGSTYSGEIEVAKKIGIEVYQFGRTCPHQEKIRVGEMVCQECGQCWVGLNGIIEEDYESAKQGWELAKKMVEDKRCDVLILDEINNTFRYQLLDPKEIAMWLETIPQALEVVLTGREAPLEIQANAHLISEITAIKHPYNQGIHARRGIEY